MKILLLDDQLNEASLVAVSLNGLVEPVTVRGVETCAATLLRLQTEKFDVVLVDERLAHTSGTNCIREMRRLSLYDGVIILVSGLVDSDVIIRAIHAGADDVVSKLQFMHELSKAIVDAIARRSERTAAVDMERQRQQLMAIEADIAMATARLQRGGAGS